MSWRSTSRLALVTARPPGGSPDGSAPAIGVKRKSIFCTRRRRTVWLGAGRAPIMTRGWLKRGAAVMTRRATATTPRAAA